METLMDKEARYFAYEKVKAQEHDMYRMTTRDKHNFIVYAYGVLYAEKQALAQKACDYYD